MRGPGFEPGSTGIFILSILDSIWKPMILTTELPTHKLR